VINNNPQCPPAVIDSQWLSRINAIAWIRLVGKRGITVGKSQREVHVLRPQNCCMPCFFAITLKTVNTFPRNLALSYNNEGWTLCALKLSITFMNGHEWYGTAISGTICPCRRPAWPTGFALCSRSPIVLQYQLLNCLRSAAERFLFPVLIRGTNYQKKSPLQHLYLPFNVTSRHFYLENHVRTLLLIDTSVDLLVTWIT